MCCAGSSTPQRRLARTKSTNISEKSRNLPRRPGGAPEGRQAERLPDGNPRAAFTLLSSYVSELSRPALSGSPHGDSRSEAGRDFATTTPAGAGGGSALTPAPAPARRGLLELPPPQPPHFGPHVEPCVTRGQPSSASHLQRRAATAVPSAVRLRGHRQAPVLAVALTVWERGGGGASSGLAAGAAGAAMLRRCGRG